MRACMCFLPFLCLMSYTPSRTTDEAPQRRKKTQHVKAAKQQQPPGEEAAAEEEEQDGAASYTMAQLKAVCARHRVQVAGRLSKAVLWSALAAKGLDVAKTVQEIEEAAPVPSSSGDLLRATFHELKEYAKQVGVVAKGKAALLAGVLCIVCCVLWCACGVCLCLCLCFVCVCVCTESP